MTQEIMRSKDAQCNSMESPSVFLFKFFRLIGTIRPFAASDHMVGYWRANFAASMDKQRIGERSSVTSMLHLSRILCFSTDPAKFALQHGAIQPRDR